MLPDSISAADRLWSEYGLVFKDLDDLTLGRWMAQTLGQFRGRAWRLSHPLVGTYRLAIHVAIERELWQKRLIAVPHGYHSADCCAAPALPLFSRDIKDTGLVCEHCGETLRPFDDLPDSVKEPAEKWAATYQETHHIAHWNDEQKSSVPDYQAHLQQATKKAETLLHSARTDLLPLLLDEYPAIVWEDQDECLDVRPEDVLPA